MKLAPTASSSYEDASSSSGEEEETDYESDSKLVEASSKPNSLSEVITDSPVVKPPADSSNKLEANSSPEEEETDSESETEEPPAVTDPRAVETSKPSSSAVKPPADSNNVDETSQKHVTKKRPIETDEGEAKRIKMDDTKSTGQETKKNYFQRVWTKEDEITILQGIIDYQNETGSKPFDDKNALYDLLKNSVSINPSKSQFFEKIRALKSKYGINLGKEKKRKGAFSKPHDLEAFRLSQFVWGNDDNAIEVEPPVLKLVGPAAKKQEFVPVVESLARFGVDDLFAKRSWSKLSLEDKKRHEKECEALLLEELNLYSRKSRFIHDAVTNMAEACQQNH